MESFHVNESESPENGQDDGNEVSFVLRKIRVDEVGEGSCDE